MWEKAGACYDNVISDARTKLSTRQEIWIKKEKILKVVR